MTVTLGLLPRRYARVMLLLIPGVALSIVHRLHLMALSLAGGLLFFLDKDKVTRAEMEREVAQEEEEEAALDDEMASESGETSASVK